MAKQWEKEKERAINAIGGHAWFARFGWFLGVIFAVVGVIGELMNTTLGLAPMSWYLLSIAAFASGILCVVPSAIGLYLYAKESKK